MSETTCQVFLLVLGGGAITLISRGGRWALAGFVLGLASTPFWTLTASRAGQWGMLILTSWYGVWYGLGAWRRSRPLSKKR